MRVQFEVAHLFGEFGAPLWPVERTSI
jgi:hypothetical protein